MEFDPMTGTVTPNPKAPPKVGGDGPTDNGGITVSAMSTGVVKVIDNTTGQGWELDPFLAADVGQRLVSMGIFQIQQRMLATQGNIDVTEAKPKLDIVRANLPKGVKT